MKLSKNTFQILILLVVALALMATMFLMLLHDNMIQYNDTFALLLATCLVVFTTSIYFLLVIRRINPKKYIYLSYSNADADVANRMSSVLDIQFHKLSKYRFEVLTNDSISFGDDIYSSIKENISKADIIIIIVSPEYIRSSYCQKEFHNIIESDKRIIPVVTASFNDLSMLPKNISNVKALSLINCRDEASFNQSISLLAKDLIKQRKD